MTREFLTSFTAMIMICLTVPTLAENLRLKTAQSEGCSSKIHLIAIGKSRIYDPPAQQQRALAAVRLVTQSAMNFNNKIKVETLTEKITHPDSNALGKHNRQVNTELFKSKLIDLHSTVGSNDTVIIYTHTHGIKTIKNRAVQRAGGMILNPGKNKSERGTVFSWTEFADLVLKIPAKKVIVLTMACYSGGLVKYFDTPEVKKLWQNRLTKEHREFIAISSQNSELMSMPIVKNGRLINPFTLALSDALSGKADGFKIVNKTPITDKSTKDSKISAGELIDFILYFTENTASEAAGRRKNNADPKITGCYDRSSIIL
jgi:hypothetical protein